MGNREQYIIVGASSTDSASPEMLFPASGGILTIEGMTSGNVLLQSYETGSWATLFTYTSDQSVKPSIAPGTLVRVSWNTVVGTPAITLLPASDNGFAEAAADIIVLEEDVTDLTNAIEGILSVNSASGNYTVASTDNPFASIYVYGTAAGASTSVIINDTVAANCPANMTIQNASDKPAFVYYSSSIGTGIYIASGTIRHLINKPSTTTFIPTVSGVVFIAKGAGTSHTGSTAETTLATVTLPARVMGTDGLLRVTSFWTFTGAGGTRTPRVKFGGTNVAGNSNASTILSQNIITNVSNKTASTQTATGLGLSTGVGAIAATSLALSIDTTADVTILLTGQLANSGDSVTLDRYMIEVVR